jgi:hypothetical protein
MGALTMLRVVRRIPGLHKQPEHPHLETLIEQEAGKIKDGYHHARWIAPLGGLLFSLGCFMPLALTVHPLFWIGTAGAALLGAGLGAVFHWLSTQISSTQVLLRQRCMVVGQRLVALQNLLGVLPTLSPKVAEVLEEAASIYLRCRPHPERDRMPRASDVWDEALPRAQRAMDSAMVQMLALAEPETPQAQEVELERGWAGSLLNEMRATARALESHAQRARQGAHFDSPASSLAGLMDARADLERLDDALAELDQQASN